MTYRVDSGSPVGSVVRTEVLEVNRPWQSRLTTRRGKPPGGRVTDTRVSDFGAFDVRTPRQDATVLAMPPDVAASDLRLDVSLRALERAQGVIARERRVVLGRPCQVYRSDAPPQGQRIGVVSEKSADVVDSCVDRDGVVLEQLQFFNGKLLLRRRAVSVETAPKFAAGTFAISAAPTVPVSLGGGSVGSVDPAAADPGTRFFLDDVPAGFGYQGRYLVVPSAAPKGGLPDTDRRVAYFDVWVRGVDVLMLEQGGLLYGGDALGTLPLATSADAGPLGAAQAAPGARVSQVAVRLPDGRYVRLAGTLPVERLTALLRTLRRVD